MTAFRHPVRKSTLAIAALIAMGAVPTQEALATSCTWLPGNGNWATAGSWSCGIVPTGPNQDSASIGATKTVTVNSSQSIFTLVNAGTINIDAFLLTLQGGGSTTNSGTINVGGASTAALQMFNNIDNTGGTISIGTGSFLNQFTGTITGGTITTSGTGALVAFSNGGNVLSGVTFNGLIDASTTANSRERIANGMTLNGSVSIGNGGIVSFDSTLGANNAIGGNATFNLNDAGARLAFEGNGTTTLGANVVVQGQGNVGQALFTSGNNTLVNNGRISANVNGGTLALTPPGGGGMVVNNGTLDARGGGLLQLAANITNTGSITAQNGSTVLQSGVTISGGTISTVGTGAFQAASTGNNVLDHVTVSGLVDLSTVVNSRERIANGMTLNGAVNVANGGILSFDSTLTAGGAQTLAGTATINLNDGGARLSIEGDGATTFGSGVTVRGQGTIGQALFSSGTNTLTSNGLISADVSGGTLNLVAPGNAGSFVNNGTLQAINGGTLLLSTNITANPGSQIVSGAGSTVVQNGITINGTFTSSGGGLFTASSSGSNVLNTVTFNGALDASSIANARERIANGLTINGAVNIGNGGIVSLDSTLGAANTIGGSASFNLNDSGAWLAIEGDGSTTLGSNIVVHGQGHFGQALLSSGNNTLTNNGLISADVTGGTLNIQRPANAGSFVNNGTLQAINGGTLLLSTDINANAGSQILAQAGSLVVQNSVTINGAINVAGALSASSSGANVLNNVVLTGTLDAATVANARERIANNLTLNGVVNIANGGIVSFDSTLGAANVIGGTGTFNLNDPGAWLAIEGNGSTTLGTNITVRGQGHFGQALFTSGSNALTNNGLISADVAGGTLNVQVPGDSGSLTNHSNIEARNGGMLLLSTSVDNTTGAITARAGSTVTQNGVTITGGQINTIGNGTFVATSNGSNFLSGVTLSGLLDLSAATNARERIVNGATLNGSVNIGNGGILSLDSTATTGGSQTIGGSVVVNLNDSGARLSIEGDGATTLGSNVTIRGQGVVGQALFSSGNNTLINNGLILADGGTLTVTSPGNAGTLAGAGTLQASGGTLALATTSLSTQGKLIIGSAGSALSLGTQNLAITNDYTNAQSGSGNAFDRRAAVTGSGRILAGGNAAQAITGSGVTNGTTANATLTLGNVRVGTTTYDYQIANTGTSGPTLRGAIQTNVNAASLTDSRLSGVGVTAGNYVTGGPGQNTGSLAVTFTAANAGALAPLIGQSINLSSNFDNIADQKLNIVLAGGAAAYNAAIGSATSPVQVANQRIGGGNSATVTVANTALAGGFSEDLRASVGATSGNASGSGSITGRLAGTSNTGSGAITVGVDTSAAGARTGTVTINYQTAGAVNGVSNGLGVANVGSQAVTVNGSVFQTAAGAIQTAALNFGTVQVGQLVSQNLVIRNTATGPAGFVEDLNAGFGATSGTGASLISGAGALSGILAGTNSTAGNGAMTVSVNTSAAGVISGAIGVNYTTAGAVNGVSNGLGMAAAGSQSYGVTGTIQTSGNVINQANPLVNNPSINFGATRVGSAASSASVSLTNVATVAPQAALNASIASNGAPITVGGVVTLLAPGATSNGLQVGLSTATAGNFTGANAGSATITLVSDASNVGGCTPNCQLTLASQQVSVSGKVYAPAAAQVNTPSVNFGIVHVGDVVTRAVSVTNSAPVAGLNDVLRGSLGAATGPFTATGSLAGLAAQATSATTFQAGLSTATAGAFNGSATATFLSHDDDLSDLALGSSQVLLSGQVNNYALASIVKTQGTATLSQVGNVYTLDFGTLLMGGADLSDTLEVLNGATGLADLLRGAFATGGVGPEFMLTGFSPFSGLAAGFGQDGFGITLDSANAGAFSDTIILHAFGSNASGYDAALADTTLVLRGDVTMTAAVPEPETYALMLIGMLMLAAVARSRRRARDDRRG